MQVWRSEAKKDVDKLESTEKSRIMTRSLGHVSYKERQNQWDLLTLKKTEGDTIKVTKSWARLPQINKGSN